MTTMIVAVATFIISIIVGFIVGRISKEKSNILEKIEKLKEWQKDKENKNDK